MTLQVHLEARKYLPKVHLVLFRIVPIDCIAGKLFWVYALNWIKCVSETIYSLLPRHIPMSFSGRKKRKLRRIPTHTTKLYFDEISSGNPYFCILFRVWCSQTECKIKFGHSIFGQGSIHILRQHLRLD